ncbi:BmGPI5, Sexual stage antigen, Pfam s48/45 [Babesia microti strain RI]|uniref:BmGPI5, Sexual stage antigen, Pfam s48/45 n=1 Tax=Babesia microti (strain RI) TaxID=1133968 RepID=I7I830_BABMR|nr:BmGPI5, Sexual stage antigen, Pfam s48/45 [Babesia microti strain RI]CCF72833.1 BmGPI5, Sexual stage antigen, Pfam s48/45 [Babesia microti strain RI]|eukprot:XP_012647442.1 BmGPI5, Sexual stage antigen, Pfam s48/45 [Babesia microti strain RI]
MFIILLVVTNFTQFITCATNENERQDGFVDKMFKNGNEWKRFCTLFKPEDKKRPFTHCSVNMHPHETVGIKCPRFLHRNYDIFPLQENHIYTSETSVNTNEVTDPAIFNPEELNLIGKHLSSVYDKDGYNVILSNGGTNDNLKSLYYICGVPSMDTDDYENIDNVGIMLALINIVLLPPNQEDNTRYYNIHLDTNPIVSPYQDVSMIREVDYYGIYKIDCGKETINVQNPVSSTVRSASYVPSEKFNKNSLNEVVKALTRAGNEKSVESTASSSHPSNVITINGLDILKSIKSDPDKIVKLNCQTHHSIVFASANEQHFSPEGIISQTLLLIPDKSYTRSNSLTFSIPVHLKAPICSPTPDKSPENYIYDDRILCKYNASTTTFSTLYCPRETHTFDIKTCKRSFQTWQNYRTNKMIFDKDFNVIAVTDEYYMFLYKNLSAPFTQKLICSCQPKQEVTEANEVSISITPKLDCDFTDPNPSSVGIINNSCNRVVRPGETIVVICREGDVIYPKKGLAYFGNTVFPFDDIDFEGTKRSDLKVVSVGNDKFLITLPSDTKIFLGQQYVFSCSSGKGIREVGFPIKDTGVVIITTGNPNFPQSIDKKLPTLVKKLKQNEYGYYNLKLSYGDLEVECKNYLHDTNENTSALYPINWTDMYSAQSKRGIDPRTMHVVHPNQFMGFHGISFKKLPDKQKLPSILSVSIKNDAIVLHGRQYPLYFVCMDLLEDSVWDGDKGRFAVFEIEFDLDHKEMVGCGVYPKMFKDGRGNVMTNNNCEFDMNIHDKVGFHCPLSNENPIPPVCYAGDIDKKSGTRKVVEIFKRPTDLYEFRSLWIFTKDMLKYAANGSIECSCISQGETLATITISNTGTYIISKLLLVTLILFI